MGGRMDSTSKIPGMKTVATVDTLVIDAIWLVD